RLLARQTWFGPMTTTDLAATYKAAKAGTATKRRRSAIKALICAPQPGRRLAHRKAGPGRSRRFICYSQFPVDSCGKFERVTNSPPPAVDALMPGADIGQLSPDGMFR